MDLELIKKLNHFNIYANLGFQFDGIEQIYKDNKLIYELHCSGGLIK